MDMTPEDPAFLIDRIARDATIYLKKNDLKPFLKRPNNATTINKMRKKIDKWAEKALKHMLEQDAKSVRDAVLAKIVLYNEEYNRVSSKPKQDKQIVSDQSKEVVVEFGDKQSSM